MAFTVKQVKAILTNYGVSAENLTAAAEEICGNHSAVIDAIKEERDNYKKDSDTLKTVQKELDDLKSKDDDGYKAKYEAEKTAHEKLKAEIAEKETKAAKDKALRAYFESKNITGKNLEIAMRASTAELSAMELDGDKIKNTAAFDALIGENGALAGLVSTTQITGANITNPPANTGGSSKTKEEIMAIKDTATRQAEMAKNPKLFGI